MGTHKRKVSEKGHSRSRQKRIEVPSPLRKKSERKNVCHSQTEKDSSISLSPDFRKYRCLPVRQSKSDSSENFNYFCHVSRSDRKRFELVKFSFSRQRFQGQVFTEPLSKRGAPHSNSKKENLPGSRDLFLKNSLNSKVTFQGHYFRKSCSSRHALSVNPIFESHFLKNSKKTRVDTSIRKTAF